MSYFSKMVSELRTFIDSNPSMDNRISQKAGFVCAVEQLVCEYNDKKELHKPITYIRNGLGKWYTCLLYLGMEPTKLLLHLVLPQCSQVSCVFEL